jgi:arylsulfatase A-like enzyme
MHFYEPHYPYVRHTGDEDLGSSRWLRYLSEVRGVDAQIGRFLDELARLGLADDTAVIITADHGEEFGEHGGEFHGDLYPEDLHVPMVIAVPGAAPARVDSPVALIDLAPTITDLLGVAAPPSFDGRTLLPAVDGGDLPAEPVFAELLKDKKVPRRMFTVIDGGWQLVVDFALGARELYHLDVDPFAQRNRLADDPAQATRLEQLLRRGLATRFGHVVIEKAGKKPVKPDDDPDDE